jgi:VIT1/CCC1 family predicted Fe2+/Mn2+ transporter
MNHNRKCLAISHISPVATAIRNYQFLKGKAALDKAETLRRKLLLQRYFRSRVNDQFHSHYCSFHDAEDRVDPLRRALMRYMPSFLAFSDEEKMSRAREYSEGKAPREVSVFVDRLTRFLVAMTGGIFLVVPMIIMTLHQSKAKSLITVSVCIVLFALITALGVRVSNVETLMSTATYAAVLMVFLGVNN